MEKNFSQQTRANVISPESPGLEDVGSEVGSGIRVRIRAYGPKNLKTRNSLIKN